MSDAILKVHIVVNGSKYVLSCNMLGNKIRHAVPYGILKCLGSIILLHEFFKRRIINELCNPVVLCALSLRELYVMVDVHHHGRKDNNISLLCLDDDTVNSAVLYLVRKIPCDLGSCRRGKSVPAGKLNNLACCGIKHILRQDVSRYTGLEGKLLIKFISSDFGKIISPCIEEHALYKGTRALLRKRLAGTYLFVEL